MTLAPGERLGPYEIESVLGAGGFGRVYRARDPRLARSVAIKVLSDEAVVLSSRGVTEEARAAAALSHPHICSVYEVERDNGVDYIVMELLDGHPLSDLVSGGALPVSTAVRYGVQIADALAHAHARGVFHGDVKPGNVMVGPQGQSKIVDFGLARRVRAAGDAVTTLGATSAGAAATGTPAYMAPEVLRGGSFDARSDIWSLGVLLHEMIAGALPFPGRTVPEMLSAILRDAPRALPSDTPAGLGAVVRRCLAKEPEDRYQTAGEVRSALETIATGETEHADRAPVGSRRRFGAIALIVAIIAIAVGSTAAFLLVGRHHNTVQGPTSLAVLPCRTLAERDRLEYLEVGIADSIIIALSNLAQLRVRGTSTILPYQGHDVDLREVGESLRVDYLLTCTLQPTRDRLAATVQFVRVADRSTAWGDRYEVPRDNLTGLQDQVAERVASALQIRLTADERARLYRRYTDNASAYEAYLQGRAVLPRYTRAATLAAIEHFKRALGLDPTYALAHAGLASGAARMRIRFSTVEDGASWLHMAKREADEALRLDPGLAEAHESRAAVAREGEFDWGVTMDESARALALNPSLSQPHFFRAGVFYHLGLMERVEREIGLGHANDPLNRVEPLRLRGTAAFLDGRFAEAATLMEEARQVSELESTGAYTGLVRYYLGRRAEAEALLETLGPQPRAQAALASILAARGDRKRASALVRELETAVDLDHHVAYSLGAAHAQLGDPEEAFKWLERAGATGFPCVPWFERDPLLAPLRNDARYPKLIADLERRVEEFRKRYDGTSPRS